MVWLEQVDRIRRGSRVTFPIPSKPSHSIKQVVAVHPACPCLQTDSRLKGKGHIFCPDTHPKAITCVVGQSNGLFGSTEGQDSQNWTKDLKGRNQCKWTSNDKKVK